MKKPRPRPYAFIQRHYRDPGGDDPVERWLPHPETARAICAALFANRMPYQDMQDAMQDVFLKALAAFRRGAPVPATLEEMQAYCATIAKRRAISTLRMAIKHEEHGYAGPCDDADEHAPPEHRAPEQRDPVDAGRQLEVAAQLFREGRMPAQGVAILAGIVEGKTHEEIAKELGITADAVEGRMRMMRDRYRARMVKLGLFPGMKPLRVVVSNPQALAVLRKAA